MKKNSIGILPVIISILALLFSVNCGGGGSSNDDTKYPEKSAIGSYQVSESLSKSFISGSTVYVTYEKFMSGDYGIYAINVSNPVNPSLTATTTTPDRVQGMAFDSGNLYVLHLDWDSAKQWYSKLIEFDTADLTTITNSIDFDEYGEDVAITNGHAFVSFTDSTNAMRVIDLSTFTEADNYSLNGGSYHTRINGSRVYLSGQEVALEIINIPTPATSSHISSFDNPFTYAPHDLCIYNNYALLSCGSLGVAIIDISNEASPAFVKFDDEPGFAIKMITSGSMLFLADQDSGVAVVDASGGLDNTVIKGICKTKYTVQDICVSGNYVYAVSTDSSSMEGKGLLEVFDISSWMK